MKKVVSGGHILIEVPHAEDYLLSSLACEEFKQFTLWSQHLVLHTRESLRKILNFVGLEEIKIEGVQRYPLSNHLNWLANGKAGGHKSSLSSLDSDALCNAYQNALARVDATDTLSFSVRLRNDGNLNDGLIVQLRSSHSTDMGFNPPDGAIVEDGVEYPRTFEIEGLSRDSNFTIRGTADVPTKQIISKFM